MSAQELSVALEAVERASSELMKDYARFQAIANAPADITTEADRRTQEIVLEHLRRHFPEDALCAEEETPTAKQAPATGTRIWIVDPIDGTRGFARKNGEFSIMVALVANGTIEVGIVAQPAFERLTYATRGQGCWRRDAGKPPDQCHVSAVTTLGESALTQSRSKDPTKRSPLVEAINPKRTIETYSAGVKLALVARGEADLYLNDYVNFHDWDIAAGHLLVTEAGGTVTGLRGQELRYGLPGAWQRNGLVATNGRLQAAALQALAKALPTA